MHARATTDAARDPRTSTPLEHRSAVMIALAGALAAALFVYLFYALTKPERF
jgi:K+-transporting ATPase KdpF subunit